MPEFLRSGARINLLVGNVAAKVMMAATAHLRLFAVLTARAIIMLLQSRARFGSKKRRSNVLRQKSLFHMAMLEATEGCSKLKRSVDMTSSGKNGLNN